MQIIAKGKTSTVELLIIEQTGDGGGVPVLSHFPTTAIPTVGETIAVDSREFAVIRVTHTFHVTEENRHGIIVDVRRTK